MESGACFDRYMGGFTGFGGSTTQFAIFSSGWKYDILMEIFSLSLSLSLSLFRVACVPRCVACVALLSLACSLSCVCALFFLSLSFI